VTETERSLAENYQHSAARAGTGAVVCRPLTTPRKSNPVGYQSASRSLLSPLMCRCSRLCSHQTGYGPLLAAANIRSTMPRNGPRG
jgi:hypothetical protein